MGLNGISYQKRLGKEKILSALVAKNDFSKNKGSLHVHHMDGVKWNHNIKNLRVLCIDCHRKEPGHSFGLKKAG